MINRSSAFCSFFKRRALARISSTDMPGVSSRKAFVPAHSPDRHGKAPPFVLAQIAAAQTVRVDARLRTKQTIDQLLVAHFKGEDADHCLLTIILRARSGVLRDV